MAFKDMTLDKDTQEKRSSEKNRGLSTEPLGTLFHG